MDNSKSTRRWLILEDSPRKAEYFIDSIIVNSPKEDIIWFYPVKDNFIETEQVRISENDYGKKGLLKREFRTKKDETVEIAFYWLKTKEEFFQYFGDEVKRANQILLLDVQLQLFDSRSVKPFLNPLKLFQQQQQTITTIATIDASPMVQARLISKDKNVIDKNAIWGDYPYEMGDNFYEDCQKTIELSDKKWHELYNPQIPIETFLQKMSTLSVAACHNWNDQTSDSIKEYIAKDSWDTKWQMPLQLSLLIKLLGSDPEWFVNKFKLKRSEYFTQGHPIAECLKTLGTKDDGSISLLGAAFIAWAAYRNIFGGLHSENDEKFIKVIQNCKSSRIARYQLITPIQQNSTLQKTMLAFYEMMKQLMTNYDNNDVCNLKSVELSEVGLSLTLQNFDFEVLSNTLSGIYKKRFITKEAQHANDHTTSNRIVDYFAYSNYCEVPSLDKSTPTFGNFFGLRIYPSNVDNEIVLRFEHTLDKQPSDKPSIISAKDLTDSTELEAAITEHEKDLLLAINDESTENFSAERQELDRLIGEGEELERQGDFSAAKEKYHEAIGKHRFYLKTWEKLSQLHVRIPNEINLPEVLDEKKQIGDLIKFEHNIKTPKQIHKLSIRNMSFFDDFDARFGKVNVILGKNGFGKSYLLRILAVLGTQDRNGITHFFEPQDNQDVHTSNKKESLELQLRNANNTYTIKASKAYPGWIEGEIAQIPMLAIPETRFIDKSTDRITKGENFDFRKYGAHHLIEQKPFGEILNNVFFALGIEMLNGTVNEKPFLDFVQSIMSKLIGDPFFYNAYPTNAFGHIRIDVQPQGSNRPIAIQKASQGTLSVISIFSCIYLYLNKLYPRYTGKNLLHQRAVVFIEEVDAHLHPSWQNKVVHLLTETFPNIQFFFTAHSPLVVAGRDEGEVSVLRKTKNGKFVLQQLHDQNFVGATTAELYKIIFDIEDKDETYLSGYHLEEKVEQKKNLSKEEEKQYKTFKEARAKRREQDSLEMSNAILKSELKRQQRRSDLEKEIVYLIRKKDLDDEEKNDLGELKALYGKSLDVQIGSERINELINQYADKI